jgi:hypothetical protein
MAVAGVKPAPVDLPGGVWQLASGDGSYEVYLTPPASNNAACFHNTASAGLSLASNGSYQKPGIFTISAEIGFAGDSPSGYFLLGFYSALAGRSASSPMQNFTGLALLKDGSVELVENGKASPPVKYTGSHEPAAKLTLTYSVDAAKGSISNISLSGSSSTYTMTSAAFSDAATAFVGVGGVTDGTSFCYLDSLKVTAGIVPPAPAPDAGKAEEP